MNDQDPLAQLRDIHMPDTVGFWPPAPGWWILAALFIALGVVAIVWRYRVRMQNRYRGEATKTLDAAWQQYKQDSNPQSYLLQLTQLIKRTALTAYPDLNINGLHGQAWLEFLDSTLADKTADNKKAFTEGPGKALLDLPYREIKNNVELKPLHELCILWLNRHRPQKRLANARALVESNNFHGATHNVAA